MAKTKSAVEERNIGRLSRRLNERQLRVWVDPIVIIHLKRVVDIVAERKGQRPIIRPGGS